MFVSAAVRFMIFILYAILLPWQKKRWQKVHKHIDIQGTKYAL